MEYQSGLSMDIARSVLPNVDWGSVDSNATLPLGPNDVARQNNPGVPGQSWSYNTPSMSRPRVPPQTSAGGGMAASAAVQVSSLDTATKHWLGEQGLSDGTIQKIQQFGFTSKQAVAVMRREDITAMDVQPLAQQRLLQSIIESSAQSAAATGHSAAHVPPATAPQGLQDNLSAQIAQLFSSLPNHDDQPGSQQTPATLHGERIDLNPLAYLLPRSSKKYLDITEFVQAGMTESEEAVMGGGGGTQIVFKSGPQKPRLENVTPMQWSAANMRIAFELVRSGQLQLSGLFEYIAYTIKVSELAQTYLWQSVLQYDRAYRQLQVEHGFKWGSDTPHLATVHLKPRSAASGSLTASNRRPDRPSRTAQTPTQTQQSQVCRLYQRNQCPFGDSCKYVHACSAPACHGLHPLAHHGKNANSAPKNGSEKN